jgi:hypothetical protein
MPKNGKLKTVLSIIILFSLLSSEMTISVNAQDEFGVDPQEIEINTL